MAKYSPEELAALTDEERKALEEDEDDEDEDLDDPDNPADPDDDTPDPADDPEGKGKPAPKADDAPAPKVPDVDVPLIEAPDVEEADKKLADIKTEKEKLVTQFDDGELSPKEYQAKLDELNKQERDLEQAKFQAKLSADMEVNEAKREWQKTINGFMGKHPEYVVPDDAEKAKTPEGKRAALRYRALDSAVRDIAAAHPDKDGAEILELAHKEVVEAFGAAPAPKPGQDPTPPGGKKTARERAAEEVPPTLGKVPAAERSDTENPKFASLDRMLEKGNVEGYETALRALPEAEYNAYLAQQG